MTAQADLLTFDDIYGDIRNDNEKSINFFSGSEIVILKDDDYLDTEEKKAQLAGLETLIQQFSASPERISFNHLIAGNESHHQSPNKKFILVRVIEEIIRLIKEVGRWLYGLLSNRVARMDAKLGFLEQRRKIKGTRLMPVKYTASVNRLLLPYMGTESPTWVINNAGVGLEFYKRSIEAHKKLFDAIGRTPNTLDELKAQKVRVLEDIGRIVCQKKTTSTGFMSELLPGNKVFNVDIKTTEREGNTLYFTEYLEDIKKPRVWQPTSGLIDLGMDMLNAYVKEIKKEQSSTLSLTRNFEKRIKAAKQSATSWTIAYYNWLVDINRRLVSLTFQHTMRWYDALEHFISSGINA